MSPNSWAGVEPVFPNVEVRHLHAAIALGEELNFTKAAHRLLEPCSMHHEMYDK